MAAITEKNKAEKCKHVANTEIIAIKHTKHMQMDYSANT